MALSINFKMAATTNGEILTFKFNYITGRAIHVPLFICINRHTDSISTIITKALFSLNGILFMKFKMAAIHTGYNPKFCFTLNRIDRDVIRTV